MMIVERIHKLDVALSKLDEAIQAIKGLGLYDNQTELENTYDRLNEELCDLVSRYNEERENK